MMTRENARRDRDPLYTQAFGAARLLEEGCQRAEARIQLLETRHRRAHVALMVANCGTADPAGTSLALLRRCRRLRHGKSSIYLAWARAAYQVSSHLRSDEDLSVSCAAEWGNALRVAGRIMEAERVLYRGRRKTQASETVAAAEMLCMKASLDLELRRLRRAVRHATRAEQIFHQHLLPRERVRALGKAILAWVELGAYEAACAGAETVLRVLTPLAPDPQSDVPAIASVIYAKVMAAGETSDPELRLRWLERSVGYHIEAQEYLQEHATETQRLHLAWIRARQMVLLGMEELGETMLLELIGDFLAADLPTRSATSALDLVLLMIRRGDTEAARQQAIASYELLVGAGLECQGVAAMRALVEAERIDEGLVLAKMRALRSQGWRQATRRGRSLERRHLRSRRPHPRLAPDR